MQDKSSNTKYLSRLIDFLQLILENIRLIVLVTAIPTIIMIIFVLTVQSRFDATGTVLPSASNSFNRFSPMNSLLTGMMASSGDQSGIYSTFYSPSLIKSRRILEPVIEDTFTIKTPESKFTGNYMQYHDIGTVRQGVKNIKSKVKATTDYDTGILSITVSSENPELSAVLVNFIIRELDRFNSQNRIKQAERNLDFIDRRFQTALEDFQNIEDEYIDYITKHRATSLSPSAQAKKAKLSSKRDIYRNIFLTLLERRELTYQETFNDTPVLTVLDSAYVDPEKDFPKRKNMVVLTFILALIASFMILLVKSAFLSTYNQLSENEKEKFNKTINKYLDIRYLWSMIMSKSRERS
ncbi:MAG: Wzz/FepE/Etk N-terminal domain-containing protein [Candidatus Zixiibacteriota bacterium]